MFSKFLTNFHNYLLNNNFSIIENNTNNNIYFKNIGSNGYIISPIIKDNIEYDNSYEKRIKNIKEQIDGR